MPGATMINTEQIARNTSLLIINRNCLVAKNNAHSVAITIAAKFIARLTLAIPNMYKEKSVTSLGTKCK